MLGKRKQHETNSLHYILPRVEAFWRLQTIFIRWSLQTLKLHWSPFKCSLNPKCLHIINVFETTGCLLGQTRLTNASKVVRDKWHAMFECRTLTIQKSNKIQQRSFAVLPLCQEPQLFCWQPKTPCKILERFSFSNSLQAAGWDTWHNNAPWELPETSNCDRVTWWFWWPKETRLESDFAQRCVMRKSAFLWRLSGGATQAGSKGSWLHPWHSQVLENFAKTCNYNYAQCLSWRRLILVPRQSCLCKVWQNWTLTSR